MNKKWQIAELATDGQKTKFPEFNPVLLQLLINRELFDQEQIDEFLNPDYGQNVHDPFLFNQMEKTVERIYLAIDQKEKITVHGDYDADGVCASSVLVSTLRALGAEVDVYLPDREVEGYGVNSKTIDYLNEKGTKLIITCDCGISNEPEIIKAQDLGIDVIITDHHTVPKVLPPAFSIIHPLVEGEKYPFKKLAGVGVAFKLAQALIRTDKNTVLSGPKKEGFEKWLLDLVSIATITDFMPIVGENRTLVKYGLVVMNKLRREGIKAMAENANIKMPIDTTDIAFRIGPRINAAGRVDHASLAFELLLEPDRNHALTLAQAIEQNNKDRQQLAESITRQAMDSVDRTKKITIASGENWPLGLIGLVANKLLDRFGRPAFVLSNRDGVVYGSARSIPAFSVINALKQMPDLFKKYGGHPGAAGFTLNSPDGIKKLDDNLQAIAEQDLVGEDLVPIIFIDAELELDKLDWDLQKVVETFAPYGVNNPKPSFASYNLMVDDLRGVGKQNKHLKLTVRQNNKPFDAIAFGYGFMVKELNMGDKIDCVYNVEVNEWNGNRKLQLNIIDIRKSK